MMAVFRNLFKISSTYIFFGFVCLIACSPLSASTPPVIEVTVEPSTSTLMVTHTPISTQTEPPTLMPTPDIWKIQECHKALDVLDADFDWIWQYAGDIDGRGRVDMLLNFTAHNQIVGFAFDFEHLREYEVSGCLEERIFTLWLQQDNKVDAVIQGEFPTTDPRGNYSSSTVLSFDVMAGTLLKQESMESFPVYLHLASGTYGTMEHRFQLAGTTDDDLILNASREFINAVANDDKTQVVEMLHFPVDVEMRETRAKMESPEAFLKYYNAIFGDGFKERIAVTFPNYLMANAGNFVGTITQFIYGGGGFTFDEYGKVISISTWAEPMVTLTATINP